VRTVGIDLAAGAGGTAIAALDWSGGAAAVAEVVVGQDDDALLVACRGADRVGVDCPLGWPVPFVAFVGDHSTGRPPMIDAGDPRWRDRLTLRETDRACIEVTRRATGRAVRPLSVSADLLGHVAMRCAVLQHRLAAMGIPVDRTGRSGLLAEVYPAASLALWQVCGPGQGSYKGIGRRANLALALERLRSATPWLRWPDAAARAGAASDHAFDAVVAALSARAVALGRVTRPDTPTELARAPVEGWIALPTCRLDDLPAGPS
jgi:predicted nuclease with RNAse H fold